MATTAIILLSMGTLAISTSVVASAIIYANSVNKRELRIQRRLNDEACAEAQRLIQAKDYFLNGPVNCIIKI